MASDTSLLDLTRFYRRGNLPSVRACLKQWAGHLFPQPKIFGVGVSRTGTSSLTDALSRLGYRASHYPSPKLMSQGRYYAALWGYDAATDVTVSMCFKELDEAFPGSKFILTIRDTEGWLESISKHVAHPSRQDRQHLGDGWRARVRRRVYGTAHFEPEKWVEAVRTHETAVRAYFKDRPGDLLILDLIHGEGWKELCSFLGKPIPNHPFPHRNRG